MFSHISECCEHAVTCSWGLHGCLVRYCAALKEKFIVVDTGRHECQSCGYIYNQSGGDPSYPISAGILTVVSARLLNKVGQGVCSMTGYQSRYLNFMSHKYFNITEFIAIMEMAFKKAQSEISCDKAPNATNYSLHILTKFGTIPAPRSWQNSCVCCGCDPAYLSMLWTLAFHVWWYK